MTLENQNNELLAKFDSTSRKLSQVSNSLDTISNSLDALGESLSKGFKQTENKIGGIKIEIQKFSN